MSEKNKNIFIVVLIIIILLFWSNLNKVKNEKEICTSSLYRANNSLNDARDIIDEANDNIENARDEAWSSYEDMGDTLDNLETVDNI
jgi:F0F1-type ATP synthase membrane subunit b/b'